jgi:hypothetical protein
MTSQAKCAIHFSTGSGTLPNKYAGEKRCRVGVRVHSADKLHIRNIEQFSHHRLECKTLCLGAYGGLLAVRFAAIGIQLELLSDCAYLNKRPSSLVNALIVEVEFCLSQVQNFLSGKAARFFGRFWLYNGAQKPPLTNPARSNSSLRLAIILVRMSGECSDKRSSHESVCRTKAARAARSAAARSTGPAGFPFVLLIPTVRSRMLSPLR